MAGARPSSFKKGGGFLDGVDVKLVDYQFTDEFNGQPFVAGKIKDRDGKTIEKPHTLNCLLTVRVEGADEDTTTTLKVAGNFDDWTVSEDGYTITPNGDQNLSAGTAFAKLITSFCVADSRVEALLPEDEINYQPLIGSRIRLVQRTDDERTKKFGKKVDKKSGKSYDRKDLVVDQVYELPGSEPAKKTTGGKANPPSKAAKGKAAPAAAPAEDLEQLSKDTLISIIADAKGEIAKSKLSMKVLTKLMQHPLREDVRKTVFDDAFLAQEDGWTYDKAKQIVRIAA